MSLPIFMCVRCFCFAPFGRAIHESPLQKFKRPYENGISRLFLLRKRAKVAEEKGRGATAFDRICGEDMVSL